MNVVVKRAITAIVAVFVVVVLAAVGFVWLQTSRFDASMDKVYDVPVPNIQRSTDPEVIARGDHLVHSIGGCMSALCHGPDLGGGKAVEMGPLATLTAPNITSANLGAAYSDGEIFRLIRHGIKRDGRSVRFMPVEELNWLPDSDVIAMISFLRTVPPVERANQATVIRTLGKVLDRQGKVVLDVAGHIDHDKPFVAPPSPAPTVEYGSYLSRLCRGCHGEHLSGGPIPGAPPSLPTPLNLTPDATGLKGWTFADFETLMRKGVRKNGQALNPFMPVESWGNMDDTELHALFAYLQSLPPAPFGNR